MAATLMTSTRKSKRNAKLSTQLARVTTNHPTSGGKTKSDIVFASICIVTFGFNFQFFTRSCFRV